MPRRPRAFLLAGYVLAGVLGGLMVVGALWVRDADAGERFDLVRWELDTFPNRWVGILGAPFRGDAPEPDEVLRDYFELPPGHPGREPLENEIERIVQGRIDTVLQELSLNARIPVPGTFPPVDIELAVSPQVLVTSPRHVIERERVYLLRPDIEPAAALAIEARTAEEDPGIAALVVPSGGVATYPAVVSDRSSYGGVLRTAAHEWVHHYLAFYPLGFNYFASGDLRTINETVADIVGDEVANVVLTRWGDPTAPPPAEPPPPPPVAPAQEAPAVDRSAVLRELRLEVDALLAAGQVEEAERRMEEVRQELEDAGHYIRTINQAYFAWYGTYAARDDATDPLGDYLYELRERTGSARLFLETVRGWTSRAEVEAGFVRLGGTLQSTP